MPSSIEADPTDRLTAAATPVATADALRDRYERVRRFTETICDPLEIEDYVVQSMPDASPVRWHLAHTTWFFQTFVLKAAGHTDVGVDPAFEVLFNSYYNSVGEQFPRDRRGLLTRPTVADVLTYRRSVDSRMAEVWNELGPDERQVVELGIQHEQQHQELMLTDLKHLLSINPLDPIYRPHRFAESRPRSSQWVECEGGLADVGFDGEGFAYDNESPRHRTYCEPYQMSSQPVTCGEWRRFIDDGGYTRPELWTALGWSTVQDEGWEAPLYWTLGGDGPSEFTLAGRRSIVGSDPVTHVSWFEADAFARWAGARLPTEIEWERAAVAFGGDPSDGHFADTGFPHPVATTDDRALAKAAGSVWEWTASPYTPYPGFKAAAGALGEYNGKFMTQQYVLRGGSVATTSDHHRFSYRNFFGPDARWQFSGLRLARDC